MSDKPVPMDWYITYKIDDNTYKILDMFTYNQNVSNAVRRRIVCKALQLDEYRCGSYRKQQIDYNRSVGFRYV